MISLITPVHKLLPWWNLRLLGVCQQTYKDWEYIILDNSEEGFAKEYVKRFFDNGMGSDYAAECRDKIKVYHDPMNDDRLLGNGRVGKLKNKCVELTTCGDDDIIVTLDYDDFLNTRSLEYMAMAVNDTDADIINFDFIDSMAMSCVNGDMYTHTTNTIWCGVDGFWLFERTEEYKSLYENDSAFREYADSHVQKNGYLQYGKYYLEYQGAFKYEYANIRKTGDPWTLFNYGCERFVGRKRVLKKLGGYVDTLACEDLPLLYQSATEFKNVYVPYPYLAITTVINENKEKVNTLCTKEYVEIGENPVFINMMGKLFKERYDKFGLEPIKQNTYEI